MGEFLKKEGFVLGSMERDYPIAIAKDVNYISKWNNLGSDVSRIEGVIIPDDEFREGGCAVIIFERENNEQD